MIEAFESTRLRAVCEVLADTATGLKGSEIGRLLSECGIEDPSPGITKRDRLFDALAARQNRDRCGSNVVAFILKAMDPVRYSREPALFQQRRDELNKVLAFSGLHLKEDGKLLKGTPARTLTEAQARANNLRVALQRRNVHPDVLRFCRAELLTDNYFHAVLEAVKSVAEKIREKTGLPGDGEDLIGPALALGKTGVPMLAFNSLRTDTEQSEQKGLTNLLPGLFGAFRNPTAHAPKITWRMDEDDALDVLGIVSLLHRRLDASVATGAIRRTTAL
jgi:uncharacterized protein (TIGR02391 family)